VRVVWAQLTRVLDKDDAFRRVGLAQQRSEYRRLAAAGAAGDEKGQPGTDQRDEHLGQTDGNAAGGDQAVQTERPAGRHPQRNERAERRDRRQHGVQPDPTGEPGVDVGHRLVQPTTRGGGEPLRQSAYGRLVTQPHG
jgi:hypothetical protein